jgi:hypothetical protein
MKMTTGQTVATIIAVGFALLLIFDPPFVAAAQESAASSQVVYGYLFDPPVINNAAGKLDLPLLLLELAFVVFIGGLIFIAAGQKKSEG